MNIQNIELNTGPKLEYVLGGPEQAEALLFVHGLGANLRQFEPQLRFFSPDYRVLLLSLRGHGGSSGPQPATRADYAVDVLARDVLALLDGLNINRVHYVGNSLGGLVGYELLANHAARLASLTTFGATAELHVSPLGVWLLVGLTRLLGPGGMGRLSKGVTPDEAVAEQFSRLCGMAPKEALVFTRQTIADYDYTGVLRLARLPPLLLLKGERDKEINANLESTLAVLRQKPAARIVDLPDAGHLANMERPELFNRTLAGFLEECRPTSGSKV